MSAQTLENLATCTETTNENYTLHTGTLKIKLESDGLVRNLGNINSLTLSATPEFVEHFSGTDGQLDAKIPLRTRYTLEGVLEELTPGNVAAALGVAQVNEAGGCKIPLRGSGTGDCDGNIAAVHFQHQFACGSKTLDIFFWRAVVSSDFALAFGEAIVNFPILLESVSCASQFPDEPYGRIEFSEACTTS